MECNCWIGILNSYDQCELNNLHLNNYKAILEDNSKSSNRMNRMFGNQYKAHKPQDYIDGRKSMATLFKFCPNCGVKINWKAIRKDLK